ncbi:esterase-like activity of phytase family protein [Oxynema sp. CENA135]|uniref:esterase-like activity of phytase family protein n=1 Tax=Oxynema sp. CENA135 TaxID=984206 RepID=UPI00190C64BA|nr:esterase-like activity of phytase family protein [Oxynema sp. CENA135]MBK4731148.1 esterase-like activity of phytase family protein [Oxynema sp. CENA135]
MGNNSEVRVLQQGKQFVKFGFRKGAIALVALVLAISNLLSGCTLPAVSAQDRMFLDLSLEFLDEYKLTGSSFQGTQIGGLSGITYDRGRDRFYAISDDRGNYGPARFYTLKLTLDSSNPDAIGIQKLEIENVTEIRNENNRPYPIGEINPEGIAFAPPHQLYISSEGVNRKQIAPFVAEYDLETGQWQRGVPIPKTYLPDETENGQTRGVQENLGFESLTLNARSFGDPSVDPIRLFTATEAPLVQDLDDPEAGLKPKNRLLHYLISDGPPIPIAEHLYELDTDERWSLFTGLTDLLALDRGGHLLSLERSFGFLGYEAKIFQITLGSATDTSRIASLKGQLTKVAPIEKKLVLDFAELGVPIHNLEGMSFGPRLPDGSPSLIVVSDDNFSDDRLSQFLLLRVKTDEAIGI